MHVEVNGSQREVRVLFTERQLTFRIAEMAKQINQDYDPTEALYILIVLHGALLFAADLVRHLEMPTMIESIRLQSYHGTESTGKVTMHGNLSTALKGQHVLVVEDIVDSGRSMEILLQHLKAIGVKSAKIATLLDKPSAHIVEIEPDYIGFSIGKNFVIGYGLDLDGKYRNLPYVAELI